MHHWGSAPAKRLKITALQQCNKFPSLRKNQRKTITRTICKIEYRENNNSFCRYAGNKTNNVAKLGTKHHKYKYESGSTISQNRLTIEWFFL